MTIQYQVTVPDARNHLYHVQVRIPSPEITGQILRLPVWIPGSYMIRDFAKHIISITAQCGQGVVAMQKQDKQTWHCAPCEGELEINYTVYAWDLSVRSAHLDANHGFFNGTSLFLEVIGQADKPCLLRVESPQDDWKLATGMPRISGEAFAFGVFEAKNYTDLIDYPFEMGTFTTDSFEVKGISHRIVFTGKHYADTARICQDLAPICEQHLKMFGEAPFTEYTFLVMVTGDGYGGLEHQNSTSLLCARKDLPSTHESEPSEGYRNFLGLCSHEYFHAWNVKGIKPQAVMDSDLQTEAYFSSLWIFEGITSYYDDLAVLRAKKITEAQYLKVLEKTLTRLQKNKGRKLQTLRESSFDAWTKFYQQDENANNAIVSYYVKGMVAALWLDLTLRQEQAGNLDQVMQDFWQHHKGKGVEEADFFASVARVAGLNYQKQLQTLLDSIEDIKLPWDSMGLRSYTGAFREDKKSDKDTTPKRARFNLGMTYRPHAKGLEVATVLSDSPAEQAGLSAQDVIIAIDNIAVTEGTIEALLSPFVVGDTVVLHVFRRDELFDCVFKLETAKQDRVFVEIVQDSKQRADWWQQ